MCRISWPSAQKFTIEISRRNKSSREVTKTKRMTLLSSSFYIYTLNYFKKKLQTGLKKKQMCEYPNCYQCWASLLHPFFRTHPSISKLVKFNAQANQITLLKLMIFFLEDKDQTNPRQRT